MTERLEQTGSDIAFCDFRKEYESGKLKKIYHMMANYPAVIETSKYPQFFVDAQCNIWNKIYRSALFTRNDIRFPEGMLYEDVATFPKIYFKACRLTGVSKQFYHYIVREKSIMNTFDKRCLDLIQAVGIVADFFRKEGVLEEYRSILEGFYLENIFYMLSLYCALIPEHKARSAAFTKLRRNLSDNATNMKKVQSVKIKENYLWHQVSFVRRIYYRLFWYMPSLLNSCLWLYHEARRLLVSYRAKS